jgi:hypothetical protein
MMSAGDASIKSCASLKAVAAVARILQYGQVVGRTSIAWPRHS